MEFLFIDESGDNGLSENSTDHYILAGISFEDWQWKENFWKIIEHRRQISQKYGLVIDELKGSEIFSHRGPFFNSALHSNDLKWIYNQTIDLICDNLSLSLFVVVRSKEEFKRRQTYDRNPIKIFTQEIWTEYLSMYEEYLIEKSVATKNPHTGLIYFDLNQEKYVRKIVRQFARKFNQQSTYPSAGIIEDVIFRDSKVSYFIQIADIVLHFI
ncbi:MAG: DUF3800 domain-containing protein [bacterium]